MSVPTIAEAARLIAARRLSPVELLRDRLAVIGRRDPQLHAFIALTEGSALSAARRAEREIMVDGPRGPLHGIPLAIKDIYDVAGTATTCHSKVHEPKPAKADAFSVKRLRDAGAVLLGKLATHEYAIGGPSFDLPWPPARNPWNPERFTGGSSSGSAAAIASGMVLGSLGSDTGGSIRVPAALCGIAGIKPTAGLVSRAGVVPLSPSLDTAGPMAWTAQDCAILLDVIAGHDPDDPASVAAPPPRAARGLKRDIAGLSVGLVRHFHETDTPATPEIGAAFEATARLLRALGCRVKEVALPPLSEYAACNRIILAGESYALHEHNLRTRAAEYGAAFRFRVLPGAMLRAADYLNAQRRRTELIAATNVAFRGVDLLVTAAVGVAPQPLDDFPVQATLSPAFYVTPFNVSAHPAAVICVGFDGADLPIGMQIVGRHFEDATVLRLGHQLERALGTRARRPPEAP